MLPNPVYVKNQDHKWVEVNTAYCEFLGYSREALLGNSDFDFTPPEQATIFWEMDNKVFETQQTNINIEKTTNSLGETRWVESAKSYYESAAGEPFIIGVLTDITELKSREEALVIAERKAIEASKAKSEFLANMSHEIRTPMNGVLGMTQVLQGSGLTHDQAESVKIIMRSGEALMTILNDILDFSKIEAGKLEFAAKPFDLEDAVEDVVALLGTTANQKHIELILDYKNSINHMVIGDAGRVRQILTNLVGNAIKFTSVGSVLLKVRVTSLDDMLNVDIDVKDTGIGIAEENLERIFDEFSQADGSTTRLYGGTGLGLSITKSLVKAMEGHIKAESRLGYGTNISLQLEFKAGSVVKKVPPRSQSMPLLGLPNDSRVLIVDDLDQNLVVLEGLLDSLGVKPDKASSAKDAVKKIQSEKSGYDLLITDYQMPEIDGYALVKAIRSKPRFNRLKILVLSSVNSDDLDVKFSKIENCRYYQKPVRLSYLRSSIQETLRATTSVPLVQTVNQQGTKTAHATGRRILIAEDDKTNQLVLKGMLENMGYEFDIADNGQIACQLHEARAYDLILMDISMPVMDGITALKRVRATELGLNLTPIIAVTAHALNGDKERFLEAGFDSHLSKPIRANLLKEMLFKLFDHE